MTNVCKFTPQRRSLPSFLTGFGVPVAVRVQAVQVPNTYPRPLKANFVELIYLTDCRLILMNPFLLKLETVFYIFMWFRSLSKDTAGVFNLNQSTFSNRSSEGILAN